MTVNCIPDSTNQAEREKERVNETVKKGKKLWPDDEMMGRRVVVRVFGKCVRWQTRDK